MKNDIPHMLDDKLDQITEDLPTKEEFDALISTLRGVLSATGVKGKAEKQQQRAQAMAYIAQHDPEKLKSLQSLQMAKKMGFVGQAEIDQAIQMQCMLIQQKQGGGQIAQNQEEMPTLQASPRVPTVPTLQEESKPEETDMGQVIEEKGSEENGKEKET